MKKYKVTRYFVTPDVTIIEARSKKEALEKAQNDFDLEWDYQEASSSLSDEYIIRVIK
jgi:hypothetical protein